MQGPPCMCQLSHVLVNLRCEASNAFLSLSIIRSKIKFHLFQPHHPTHARLCSEREREKHYISSSHLGLIRCLTPFRVRISTIASI